MYIGSPLLKGHGPSFEQTYIPFTQGCFVPSLVEITSGSGEDGFKFHQCIFTTLLLSRLEKGGDVSIK